MDRLGKNFFYMSCASMLLAGVLSTPALGQNAEMFFVEAGVDPASFGGGPTVVDISQRLGQEIDFDIYVRALDTLTRVRGVAADVPCISQGGSGGSVTYVLGSGEINQFIREDFVFFQIVVTLGIDQSKCPAGEVRFALGLAAGVDKDITGLGPLYAGNFTVLVSEDAAGTHTFPLIGGSDIVDVDSEEIPSFKYDLVLLTGDAPSIKHGDFETTRTQPCSGYIDPRFDSTDGINVNLGLVNDSTEPNIVELTIEFSEAVFSMGGGAVGRGDFELTETGDRNPPVVIGVTEVLGDDTVFTLALSRSITVQEWTTVRALVQNADGVAINDFGNMGPGELEPDRVDIGFLPGDINQSGNTSPVDSARAQQKKLGICSPNNCPICSGELAGYDVDRRGGFSPIDLARLQQLLLDAGNSTQRWNGKSMNNLQP